ncbi:hypothetical protein Br6_04621 [Rhodococcus sp. Br-6]|nr:hypothetical protein Br6_04621 [Rhodococcus sp. Br-6]
MVTFCGVRRAPGAGPETTVGSLAERAVASSNRIDADPPRPSRVAVICRRPSDAQCGQSELSGTSAIGKCRSNGPHWAHRNW